MRKIISLMLVCMLITTTSFAGTFTKTVNGISINLDIDQGNTILIKAKEIFGKIFTGWTITGATVADSSLSEQTITMGTENITATANYATPYTVTVEQAVNGVISPGTVTVAEGSSKTFTITPDSNHEIEDVKVDGVSVLSSCVAGTGDEKTYTMSGINGNKTITATYSSTGSSGSGSVIIPTISVSSKTTNSITVSTSATDPSGGNLVYKLYANGVLKATSSATSSGTSVSLTASGLNEYEMYGLTVTVAKNGTDIGTSSNIATRTYCSGTGGSSECMGYLTKDERLMQCDTCKEFNFNVDSECKNCGNYTNYSLGYSQRCVVHNYALGYYQYNVEATYTGKLVNFSDNAIASYNSYTSLHCVHGKTSQHE